MATYCHHDDNTSLLPRASVVDDRWMVRGSCWLQSSHTVLITSEIFPRCVTFAGCHLTDVFWSLLHFTSNPNARWLQSSRMLLIMSEIFPRCVTFAGCHLTDVFWSLLHFSTDIVQSKFSLAADVTYAADHVRNVPEVHNASWLSLD